MSENDTALPETTSPGRAPQQRRVVIVDDHAMFRSGVRHDIGPFVTIVAEAEDVPSAVDAITRTLPDVVLLCLLYTSRCV